MRGYNKITLIERKTKLSNFYLPCLRFVYLNKVFSISINARNFLLNKLQTHKV